MALTGLFKCCCAHGTLCSHDYDIGGGGEYLSSGVTNNILRKLKICTIAKLEPKILLDPNIYYLKSQLLTRGLQL